MRGEYTVLPITRQQAEPFILDIHYAGRWPSITYLYGLYRLEELVGIVSYGTPPSAPLRAGVAGKENISNVLELNRLVLKYNRKNEASFLVGNTLKLLPKGKFVVSFADISVGHVGYVYQACNFRYYGLSAKRTDWKVKGREGLHGVSIADEFRGQPNRSKLMREKYGDDFYLQDRPRNHRYIYCTSKKDYAKIRYTEVSYPK